MKSLRTSYRRTILSLTLIVLLLSSSVGCTGLFADEDTEPIRVLTFHAEWCQACKRDMPAILRLTASGEYYFFIVDHDENPDMVEQHDVRRTPTYIVMDTYWEEVSRAHRIEDLE